MVSFMEMEVDLKAQLTLPVQVVAKMVVGSTAVSHQSGQNGFTFLHHLVLNATLSTQ